MFAYPHNSLLHQLFKYLILPRNVKIIQELLFPSINIGSLRHRETVEALLLFYYIELLPESVGVLHGDTL